MNINRLIYLCFAVYLIWNVKQQQVQKTFVESVQEQDLMVVEMLEERMEEMWDKTARDLYDYRKKKYRPILTAFRDIQIQFERLEQKIDSLEEIDRPTLTIILFKKTLDHSFNIYEDLLREYGTGVFGIHQDEIESRLEHMRAYFNEYLPNNNSTTNNFSYLQSRAKLLEHYLLKEITGYYQGRVICGDNFLLFPVVVPTKATPFIGEHFEAKIGIGHYASQIDPSLLRYIISGDTIPANLEDGGIEIAIPATKVGTQKLEIAYEIINPMTGKKVTHSLPYEYVVLPK
ncbi:MAG: hypothetical protein AAF806_20135 [Bacteroidota bacterium]